MSDDDKPLTKKYGAGRPQKPRDVDAEQSVYVRVDDMHAPRCPHCDHGYAKRLCTCAGATDLEGTDPGRPPECSRCLSRHWSNKPCEGER